jgi:hypothetical protein
MTGKPSLRGREAPRVLEIACGVGLAILGPLLIVVFVGELYGVSTAPRPVGAFILGLVFIAFGLFCSILAVRLLRSTTSPIRRKGLLSPRGWRTAGSMLLATAVLLSIAMGIQNAWPGVFVVLVCTAPIIRWCFVAARDADANKPLQPTRAAEPNGQREAGGNGPRG